MGTLIIRLVEHLRLRARAGQREGLRHVIVIEEAHRLLRAGRQGRASAHAVELFASMLAEIRAYGEGLVIAEQIPAKLVPDAVKNTALKVVHRLPARDDRDLVGAAMNLDEDQSRQVVSLPPGVAAVFADGMDRPVRVRVPFGGGREAAVPGPPPPLVAGAAPPAARSAPGSAPAPCWTCAGPNCSPRRTRRPRPASPARPGSGCGRRRWCWPSSPAAPGRRCPPRCAAGGLALTAGCASACSRPCSTGRSGPGPWPSGPPTTRPTWPVPRPVPRCGCSARAAGRPPGPGPGWVIPQLRWLHEMERVCPLGGRPPDPAGRAPPPDFDLPGLAGWPGMRVGHRLRALRRHRLSTELPRNRQVAWTALLGDDDQRDFLQDLATVGVGLGPGTQLRQAAHAMEAGAWLEVVLSWPRRFMA